VAAAQVAVASAQVSAVCAHRPLALTTGSLADVYLCHPFLVHAAQPHHGSCPRFIAQPPPYPAVPYELERAVGVYPASRGADTSAAEGTPTGPDAAIG
jgi:hypothetical protein